MSNHRPCFWISKGSPLVKDYRQCFQATRESPPLKVWATRGSPIMKIQVMRGSSPVKDYRQCFQAMRDSPLARGHLRIFQLTRESRPVRGHLFPKRSNPAKARIPVKGNRQMSCHMRCSRGNILAGSHHPHPLNTRDRALSRVSRSSLGINLTENRFAD